ncbi:MAG: hypothetical protein ACI4PF_05845 [Christensenellales bacterium]
MAKISLNIEDIELGYLLERGGKYLFCANEDEVNRAREEYPLDMVLFKLNSSGMVIYDRIPYPFNTFLSGTHREDLMSKAGINPDDSDYDRLYKLAGLNMVRENFEIHIAD